jgi:hypothetical protein
VKEFNRLRALEDGKANVGPAEGGSRPLARDPGMDKAMALLQEVKNKSGPSLIDDAVREEQEAILGILDRLKKVGGSTDYNAALGRVCVAIRDRMKVPAADHG